MVTTLNGLLEDLLKTCDNHPTCDEMRTARKLYEAAHELETPTFFEWIYSYFPWSKEKENWVADDIERVWNGFYERCREQIDCEGLRVAQKIQRLKALRQFFGDHPRYLEEVGDYYNEICRWEKAITCYERAYQSNKQVASKLERAFRKNGDIEKAKGLPSETLEAAKAHQRWVAKLSQSKLESRVEIYAALADHISPEVLLQNFNELYEAYREYNDGNEPLLDLVDILCHKTQYADEVLERVKSDFAHRDDVVQAFCNKILVWCKYAQSKYEKIILDRDKFLEQLRAEPFLTKNDKYEAATRFSQLKEQIYSNQHLGLLVYVRRYRRFLESVASEVPHLPLQEHIACYKRLQKQIDALYNSLIDVSGESVAVLFERRSAQYLSTKQDETLIDHPFQKQNLYNYIQSTFVPLTEREHMALFLKNMGITLDQLFASPLLQMVPDSQIFPLDEMRQLNEFFSEERIETIEQLVERVKRWH